jgi:hypothetical protein
MLAKDAIVNQMHYPVAIFDKDLLSDKSFTVQTFELCTMCGARFGIGYHGNCNTSQDESAETEELPKRLTEILAKDHRQNRAHKHLIDLDF